MARVMTLEGLSPTRLGEIRAQLAQPELSWWRRPIGLADGFIALRTHGPWIAGGLGLIAGVLLAAQRRRR
jgi:hypothetical protein